MSGHHNLLKMDNLKDPNFLTTRWTHILESDKSGDESASGALVQLCENYYFPVYCFVKNRCGDAEKARDLTQGFFEVLIETKFYGNADPERGRFRTFLLAAVKNYLIKQHRDSTRKKRGGGACHVSIDFEEAEKSYRSELVAKIPGDELFDHNWAVTIFDRVWEMLRSEYEQAGHLNRFEILRPALTDAGFKVPYAKLATQLDLSENGVKTVVFRMRSRFRELFRATVGQLLDNPGEIDEEIQYLIQAAAKDPYQ